MKLNSKVQMVGKPALRYPIKAQRDANGIRITWLVLICTIEPTFKAGYFRVHEREEYLTANEERQRTVINALYRIRNTFLDEFGNDGVRNILQMQRRK